MASAHSKTLIPTAIRALRVPGVDTIVGEYLSVRDRLGSVSDKIREPSSEIETDEDIRPRAPTPPSFRVGLTELSRLRRKLSEALGDFAADFSRGEEPRSYDRLSNSIVHLEPRDLHHARKVASQLPPIPKPGHEEPRRIPLIEPMRADDPAGRD